MEKLKFLEVSPAYCECQEDCSCKEGCNRGGLMGAQVIALPLYFLWRPLFRKLRGHWANGSLAGIVSLLWVAVTIAAFVVPQQVPITPILAILSLFLLLSIGVCADFSYGVVEWRRDSEPMEEVEFPVPTQRGTFIFYLAVGAIVGGLFFLVSQSLIIASLPMSSILIVFFIAWSYKLGIYKD